jgi:hypothetical protein
LKLFYITFGSFIGLALLVLWMCYFGPSRLPPGKEAYAGTWLADGVAFTITSDSFLHDVRQRIPRAGEAEGTFSYTTSENNSRITRIDADGITAGRWLLASHYVVNHPPAQVDGTWKMTIDGVELTRNIDPENDGRTSVGVNCKSNTKGLTCTTKRRGVREAFTSCFDVEITCEGGLRGSKRLCLRGTRQTDQPEDFPFAMFPGAEQCQAVTRLHLSNQDLRVY